MWTGPVYDCQECGACCTRPRAAEGTAYVYLNREESKRMRRLGLTVVQVSGDSHLGTRAYAGGGAGVAICVAFQGKVGNRCGCSIYRDRPRECRRFEVGSRGCRAARREADLPV